MKVNITSILKNILPTIVAIICFFLLYSYFKPSKIDNDSLLSLDKKITDMRLYQDLLTKENLSLISKIDSIDDNVKKREIAINELRSNYVILNKKTKQLESNIKYYNNLSDSLNVFKAKVKTKSNDDLILSLKNKLK